MSPIGVFDFLHFSRGPGYRPMSAGHSTKESDHGIELVQDLLELAARGGGRTGIGAT
jgi:hypothetical protein